MSRMRVAVPLSSAQRDVDKGVISNIVMRTLAAVGIEIDGLKFECPDSCGMPMRFTFSMPVMPNMPISDAEKYNPEVVTY